MEHVSLMTQMRQHVVVPGVMLVGLLCRPLLRRQAAAATLGKQGC
jgi:hypothetical protein